MTLRIGRLAIAAPVAELLAVAGIIVPGFAVFFTLDGTVTARMTEMQGLASWTAPLAGFVFCLLGGWWVARRASTAHERNGLALGAVVALMDLVLLIASGAPFGALYVSSFVARVAGGYFGGVIAQKRRGSPLPSSA